MPRYVLLLLSTLIALQCRVSEASYNTAPQKNQQAVSNSTPITIKVVRDQKTEEEVATDKAKDKHSLWLAIAVAASAIVQAGAAVWGVFIYKKQTRLMMSTLSQVASQSEVLRKQA